MTTAIVGEAPSCRILAQSRNLDRLSATDTSLRRPLSDLSYDAVVLEVARRFEADCHPIPLDFDNKDARPTSAESQKYQLRGGAGDGRSIVTALSHRFAAPIGARVATVYIGDEMGTTCGP